MDTRNRRLGPWNSLGPIIDSINDLENTNVKCTWFESIGSGTSGTITPPTGGTIVLDAWAEGVDILVSHISSGIPTFESVLDSEGVIIQGTLNGAGAWTISGTPADGYPISLIFVYSVALSDFDSAYCLDTAQVEGVNALSLLGKLTYEITGFPFDESTARSLSTIAFDDGTNTFSIAPVGDSFSVWIQGVEYVYAAEESIQIDDTVEGMAFFYFDDDGVLSVQRYADSNLMIKWALCAMVYWDATNKEAIVFSDERHTVTMDGMTHAYLHFTNGAQYVSGLQIGDLAVDGAGSADTDAEFSVTDGICVDEDLEIRTSRSAQVKTLPAQIPVFYMDGAVGTWRKDTADNFPVKTFAGGSNYLAYNDFSSPNWVQAEVSNTKYVLCHLFCTNDIDEPVIAIQGQAEYTSKPAASAGASVELTNLELSGFPVAEHVPLYTLIYQTGASLSNTVKARIVTDGSGNEYSDWRFKDAVPSGGGGGGGDVSGPISSTDNAIARFDGGSGKIVQDSPVTMDDSGNIIFPDATGIMDASLNQAIKINNAGSVELYFADVKEAETISGGLKATNSLTIAATTNVIGILDEDNMASNSAVNLVTQQSLVAYNATHYADTSTHGVTTIAGLDEEQTFTTKTLTTPIINEILTATGKTGAVLTEDGAVELYYAGTKTFETLSTGVSIFNTASGVIMDIYHSSGEMKLYSYIHGDPIVLYAENGSGVNKKLFSGDPDGAVELYHAGTKTLETLSTGISTGDGTNITNLYHKNSDADFFILNTIKEGHVRLQGSKISTGATSDLFKGDPDGAVELYYAGVKLFETRPAGARFMNAAGAVMLDIIDESGEVAFVSYIDSDLVQIKARNLSSSTKILFSGDPDGAVELYRAGVKAMSTKTEGIEIHDASTGRVAVFDFATADAVIKNENTSGGVYLQGANSGDVIKQMVSCEPDGAVELYYAGSLNLATNNVGILVQSNGNEQLTFSYSSGWLIKSKVHGGTVSIQGENTATGAVKDLFVGDPDAAVDLHFAGDLRISTSASGAIVDGGLYLVERSAAASDTSILGQIWVKNDDGNILMFTDGDGVDYTVDISPV